MTALELYKRLLQFLLPYRGKVLLAIFCSVVVGVIATSPVPLIQKTFDDIFQKKDFLGGNFYKKLGLSPEPH